jgi:hypothetical protein
MIRDAAADWLRRWRGRLIAGGMAGAALGLFLDAALAGAPLAIAMLALSLAFAVWLFRDDARRARLAAGGQGPGLVAVREGAVAYFGPLGGGMADLDALRSITMARGPHGPVWLLRGPEDGPLRIPTSAEGAEALLDAFAALPGFDPGRVSSALEAEVETLVWRRTAPGSVRLLPGRSGDRLS